MWWNIRIKWLKCFNTFIDDCSFYSFSIKFNIGKLGSFYLKKKKTVLTKYGKSEKKERYIVHLKDTFLSKLYILKIFYKMTENYRCIKNFNRYFKVLEKKCNKILKYTCVK